MPRSLLTGWTRGWCAVFISVLLVCCCLGSAHAAIDSDKLLASLKPSGFVNDYAKVFDSGQKNALEQTLTRLSLFGAENDYFQGGGGHFPLFFGGYSPKTGCGADPVG